MKVDNFSGLLKNFWEMEAAMARKADRLSVCATVMGAIERTAISPAKGDATRHLNLHFLGAEDFECENVKNCDDFEASYRPLLDFLDVRGVRSLQLSFIGPNLMGSKPSSNKMLFDVGKIAISVEFHTCLYHEHYIIQRKNNTFGRPDMVLMLNAGIWGYKSWLPTLDAFDMMSRDERSDDIPDCFNSQLQVTEARSIKEIINEGSLFVVTSYTVEEAEDDEDTIREHFNKECIPVDLNSHVPEISGKHSATSESMANTSSIAIRGEPEWLWEAEVSPFRSLEQVERLTKVPGREYYPNHAWQCFRFKATR